ncbi:MAG TPA: hypothetical protein PLY93_13585 [Turneriella sp.]|nr:hypothetical protein [Turneriella sp.]
MQGIQEIGIASVAQPTVISSEDLKALLYLTIRGHNGLTGAAVEEKNSVRTTEDRGIDFEKGVDVRA